MPSFISRNGVSKLKNNRLDPFAPSNSVVRRHQVTASECDSIRFFWRCRKLDAEKAPQKVEPPHAKLRWLDAKQTRFTHDCRRFGWDNWGNSKLPVFAPSWFCFSDRSWVSVPATEVRVRLGELWIPTVLHLIPGKIVLTFNFRLSKCCLWAARRPGRRCVDQLEGQGLGVDPIFSLFI